jgi:hypothetical protein
MVLLRHVLRLTESEPHQVAGTRSAAGPIRPNAVQSNAVQSNAVQSNAVQPNDAGMIRSAQINVDKGKPIQAPSDSTDTTNVSQDLDVSTPTTTAALDISVTVVTELFLRKTFQEDTVSLSKLSGWLGISGAIIYEVFEALRARKLIDVRTMQGNDYIFSLTDLGREFAREMNLKSQYSGIAPVSLETYLTAVKVQKSSLKVNQQMMAEAMSDLVVEPQMLDELGPAFNSQHSIFFYGPAGTGKTSLAERLNRLFQDWIVVPHAILVDGQFIVVFDPTLHEPLVPQPEGLDRRWVACKRPLVTVGGELELSALQLTYDPVGRVYVAPLHVKANNGMMLIDDFGRQVMTPMQLLNRWIYPLSKRVDYLQLANGTKVGLPFELMVAFSTNMAPEDLGDEAFFRRIQNKVYVGPVTADAFDIILGRVAKKLEVELLPESYKELRTLCLERDSIGLRANYPYDMCKMAKSIAEYEGKKPVLDEHALVKAARLYWGTANAKMSGAALSGTKSTGNIKPPAAPAPTSAEPVAVVTASATAPAPHALAAQAQVQAAQVQAAQVQAAQVQAPQQPGSPNEPVPTHVLTQQQSVAAQQAAHQQASEQQLAQQQYAQQVAAQQVAAQQAQEVAAQQAAQQHAAQQQVGQQHVGQQHVGQQQVGQQQAMLQQQQLLAQQQAQLAAQHLAQQQAAAAAAVQQMPTPSVATLMDMVTQK